MLRRFAFTLALAIAWLTGAPVQALTIETISGSTGYIDTPNSPNATALTNWYEAYRITTGGAESFDDLWVTSGAFAGPQIGLATHEDGVKHLGPMGPSETRYVYFYLEALAETAAPEQHTISVYSNAKDVASGGTLEATLDIGWSVVQRGATANNKITYVLHTPDGPGVGARLVMTIEGDTGTMTDIDPNIFVTPATEPDWPADVFELEHVISSFQYTGIDLDNPAVQHEHVLSMYTGVGNTASTPYRVVYTFRITGVKPTPTTVQPVNYLSSGGQMKHTDVDATEYATAITSAGTIPQPELYLRLTRDPASANVAITGGTVTHRLRITNSYDATTTAAAVDSITELFVSGPGTPSYVASSGTLWTYDGSGPATSSALNDPLVITGGLKFADLFLVPPNDGVSDGYIELQFDLSYPAGAGTYTQHATGQIGESTQIDTTIELPTAMQDDAPAVAIISLGDWDGDGIPDATDLDSDNDGIADLDESGLMVDPDADDDMDDVPNYLDPDVVTCDDLLPGPGDGVCDAIPPALDVDGDGIANHLDLDSDGDGITDAREAGGTDADGDGLHDGCLPVTASGECAGGSAVSLPDTDATGAADYLDTDSDDDSIDDTDEAFDSDGDGSADTSPALSDSDGDGIDDAFDPDCTGGACGMVTGNPITDPLSAAQDENGDSAPDWQQVCGDAYVPSPELCDDGNTVNDDDCSNDCQLGLGLGCSGDGQCESTHCDDTLSTCQVCEDTGSGTDAGCSVGAPLCITDMGDNACFTCIDDAGAGLTDSGCGGGTPICDVSQNGGLGACVACLVGADCNDGNECTSDSCDAGSCVNTSLDPGDSCTGGVCDGAVSDPACVACADTAPPGMDDAGCSGSTPACDDSGTPTCVQCAGAADCDDGNDCTSDSCNAGSCENASLGEGATCSTGVCDGAVSDPSCVTCVDDASGSADSGCTGGGPGACDESASMGAGSCVDCTEDLDCGADVCVGQSCVACEDDQLGTAVDHGCDVSTPMCDESGTAVCVECILNADCGMGELCNAGSCTPGCADDSDCTPTPDTPRCDLGANACVQCLSTPDCPGTEVCSGTNSCESPDSDGDGFTDEVDLDDDNDGVADADELGGTDLSVDTDGDGYPDYMDADAVACTDAAPMDGVCDALLPAQDSDGDGIPNHLDLDSDGDGLTDAYESAAGDDDGDGVPDGCLPVTGTGECAGGSVASPPDTDSADGPDFLDLDSDGDGIGDTDEAFDTDGDGSADTTAAGADTDGDGIDDAFDGDCAGAGDCGGVIGAPVTSTLTAAQDENGDSTADWLQVCGDAYVTGSEPCDDGNLNDADSCSNACLLANGESCSGGGQCVSSYCDGGLGTCQGCVDDSSGGTDSGCSGGAPTCVTDAGSNSCVVCADDTAGGVDDGCGASAPACDAAAAGGLGACGGCGSDVDCSSSVCVSQMCIVCEDDQGAAAIDHGCDASTPLCDDSGSPVCVQCLSTADCGAGELCDGSNACVPGCDEDADCSGATPRCDLGSASCVECLAAGDCSDGDECTVDVCSAGACDNPAEAAGTACSAGVCDAGAPPACVSCLVDADCGSGQVCTSGNACVVDRCASDADCAAAPGTPACDTGSGACVECTADAHCAPTTTCDAGASRCVYGDFDGDDVPDDVDVDDDGDGIPDAEELGLDAHADEDGDGVLDFEDPDAVDCADEDDDGVCDAAAAALDLDGDGLPNHLDDDADGDGLPDAQEGHDEDFDGVADRTASGQDSDGDGLDDAFDPDCDGDGCGGIEGVAAPVPDQDGDGEPNYLDADDDGDGISTADERQHARDYDGPADDPTDIDGDGLPNWYDTDSDDDGSDDAREYMDGGDVDDNGILDALDPEFRVPDSDGDGIPDLEECPPPAYPTNGQCPDSDGDGVPDYLDVDDDDDGIPTLIERMAEQGLDADGDGIPNHLDLDSDDDGVFDLHENGGAQYDSDGDGRIDGVEDADGDGLAAPFDDDDGDRDEHGTPPRVDTDGDGVPDYLDVDDDGDGLLTVDEDPLGGRDSDGDGILDHLDEDDDNDGVLTIDEAKDFDSDGDGTVDYLDPKPGGVAGRNVFSCGAAMASEPGRLPLLGWLVVLMPLLLRRRRRA